MPGCSGRGRDQVWQDGELINLTHTHTHTFQTVELLDMIICQICFSVYSGKNKRYLTPAAKCEEGPAEHTNRGDHGEAQSLTSLLICKTSSIYPFLLEFILICQMVHQLFTNCLLCLLLCSKAGLHRAQMDFLCQAAQMVSTDLALARWADRARGAPPTARSVPMPPPATNAKMGSI